MPSIDTVLCGASPARDNGITIKIVATIISFTSSRNVPAIISYSSLKTTQLHTPVKIPGTPAYRLRHENASRVGVVSGTALIVTGVQTCYASDPLHKPAQQRDKALRTQARLLHVS